MLLEIFAVDVILLLDMTHSQRHVRHVRLVLSKVAVELAYALLVLVSMPPAIPVTLEMDLVRGATEDISIHLQIYPVQSVGSILGVLEIPLLHARLVLMPNALVVKDFLEIVLDAQLVSTLEESVLSPQHAALAITHHIRSEARWSVQTARLLIVQLVSPLQEHVLVVPLAEDGTPMPLHALFVLLVSFQQEELMLVQSVT